MTCQKADFTAGGRDVLRLRFTDEVISAVTGKITKEGIDLTAATGIKAWCIFTPDGGVPGTETAFDLTKDPDQVNNKGYASREWDVADLANANGELKVRGEYTDGASKPHYQPDSLTFRVAKKPGP